jgi:hypothetical protein
MIFVLAKHYVNAVSEIDGLDPITSADVRSKDQLCVVVCAHVHLAEQSRSACNRP